MQRWHYSVPALLDTPYGCHTFVPQVDKILPKILYDRIADPLRNLYTKFWGDPRRFSFVLSFLSFGVFATEIHSLTHFDYRQIWLVGKWKWCSSTQISEYAFNCSLSSSTCNPIPCRIVAETNEYLIKKDWINSIKFPLYCSAHQS